MATTLASVTTREQLHKLVEELPDDALAPVAEMLAARREPEAVRTGDIVDDWGNLSALRRAFPPPKLSRLDIEEIAAQGETIGEAFARAEREKSR